MDRPINDPPPLYKLTKAIHDALSVSPEGCVHRRFVSPQCRELARALFDKGVRSTR